MAETKRTPNLSIEAIAVGQLVSVELQQTQPKEDGGQSYTFLKGEIAAEGSKLRFTVWPSRKKPSLPQELSQQLSAGMKVTARGTLEEQVGQDQRLYRSLRAWTVVPASDYEEEKLVYHASGHLGRLEKTAADELVVPITAVRQYEKDGQMVDAESTVRVCPSRELTAMLYEKVPVGRLIRSRGDIIAKTKIDRYGLPDGEFISRLEVALLEVWDDQLGMWTRLEASAKLPLAASPNPVAPRPPAAQPAPAPPDDEDVPF